MFRERKNFFLDIYLGLILKLTISIIFLLGFIYNIFIKSSSFDIPEYMITLLFTYYTIRISYYQKFNFIEEVAYEKNSKIISLRYYKYGGFAKNASTIDIQQSEAKVYIRHHFRRATQTFLIIKHNKKRYIFGDFGLNKVMFNSLVNQLKGNENLYKEV
jgi:hypothetical protein